MQKVKELCVNKHGILDYRYFFVSEDDKGNKKKVLYGGIFEISPKGILEHIKPNLQPKN